MHHAAHKQREVLCRVQAPQSELPNLYDCSCLRRTHVVWMTLASRKTNTAHDHRYCSRMPFEFLNMHLRGQGRQARRGSMLSVHKARDHSVAFFTRHQGSPSHNQHLVRPLPAASCDSLTCSYPAKPIYCGFCPPAAKQEMTALQLWYP
jgi:hypothetical protein